MHTTRIDIYVSSELLACLLGFYGIGMGRVCHFSMMVFYIRILLLIIMRERERRLRMDGRMGGWKRL